jgi:flagellar FliL protein
MSDDKDIGSAPKKKGKGKLLIFGLAGLLLVGGGVGAGFYASGMGAKAEGPHEDPMRPKLVLRTEHEEVAEDSGGHGGGAEKAPARRTGTVSVKSDSIKVDPHKYEIAYFPMDAAITANLADGGGFAQLSLSLATYYDSRVTDNVTRQMVPIRSAILMVMSDQQSAVLATPAGKQMLQRDLTRAINGVLREKEGFGGIDNVYFNSLVVQ